MITSWPWQIVAIGTERDRSGLTSTLIQPDAIAENSTASTRPVRQRLKIRVRAKL